MNQIMSSNKQYRLRRSTCNDKYYIQDLIKSNLELIGYHSGVTNEKLIRLSNRHLKNATHIYVFETTKGTPVGFISWTEKVNEMLFNVCVIESKYRGQGILTSFIDQLERYILDKNFRVLQLYVDMDNVRAIKLYENLGFRTKSKNWYTGKMKMERVCQEVCVSSQN